jgi:hypothetical protein
MKLRAGVRARCGAEERLGLLLQLAAPPGQQHAEGTNEVPLHVGHEGLAKMAAMNRSHVSVTMGKLRNRALVRYERSRALVVNVPTLTAYLTGARGAKARSRERESRRRFTERGGNSVSPSAAAHSARCPKLFFQSVERGAYLAVGRALLVVRFDPRPRDAPGRVDDVNGRARYPVRLLAGVGRIAQAVSVDSSTAMVGQKRKGDFAALVPRDLFSEPAALSHGVNADGIQSCRLIRF